MAWISSLRSLAQALLESSDAALELFHPGLKPGIGRHSVQQARGADQRTQLEDDVSLRWS
jgi:hypothetical protein